MRNPLMSPIVLSALLMLLISGCARTIPGAKMDLLEFLNEGNTTREQVITTLGQPSGSFEQDRILTYRMGHKAGQGYFLVSPRLVRDWSFVRYSLVLIFDANGVLQKQNLVDLL